MTNKPYLGAAGRRFGPPTPMRPPRRGFLTCILAVGFVAWLAYVQLAGKRTALIIEAGRIVPNIQLFIDPSPMRARAPEDPIDAPR